MPIKYEASEVEATGVLSILLASRSIHADRLTAHRVTVMEADPIEHLERLEPDVLVIDGSLVSALLAEHLALPRHADLPLVVLAGPDDAEAVGLLLERRLILLDEAGEGLEAALAGIRPAASLADAGNRFDEADRLASLRRDAERIAAALAELAATRPADAGEPRPVTAARIRAHIKARRLRERFLPADLFADPAWDMLLDLAAARLEGTMVSVSSLCIAGNVPTTTALRWIKTLVDRGLVLRTPDPDDARRSFIHLAPQTVPALEACLAAVLNHPGQ